MTLMELLVALVVLSLMASLAFSSIGSWIGQSRASAQQAGFWRTVPAAQLALSELTAGAINPEQRRISATEAHFRALAPRLAGAPIDVTLRVRNEETGSRLLFSSPQLPDHEGVLLNAPAPLRLITSGRHLTVEMSQGGAWTAIASGAFVADAPLVCAFDLISSRCR